MVSQSTWQFPPVHCAPHSTVWPAMVPAESLSQSSFRHSNSWIIGASARPVSVTRPVITICAPCASASATGNAPKYTFALCTLARMVESGSPVSMFFSVDAASDKIVQAMHDVVAGDSGDLDCNALLPRDFEHRLAASRWIHAARVGDYADASFHQIRQHPRDHVDEVARVAGLGIARPLLLQDRHGHFGQIVQRQVIDRPSPNLFDRSFERVAPEALSVRNSNHFFKLGIPIYLRGSVSGSPNPAHKTHLTTITRAKPSSIDGGSSLAAMRSMASSGTTRFRRRLRRWHS